MRTLTVTLLGLLLATSAHATTHRTFVSAEGADSGVCGPTTPCRTLAYALGQTDIDGEIVITKSGGYGDATGGLTINKSVSIIAEPGVFAALAPTSGNGVTIATAGIDVVLKGLTINGRGGNNGVLMTAGSSLRMYNCTVSGFMNSNNAGISINAAAYVLIANSVVSYNLNGIVLDGGAKVDIDRTSASGNSSWGVIMAGPGGASGNATTTASITNSIASQNGSSGFAVLGKNTSTAGISGYCSGCTRSMTVTGSDASHNYSGFFIMGPMANMTVAGSSASNNIGYGFSNSGGSSTFYSAGNNTLADNGYTPTNGTITTTVLLY